MNHVHSLIQTLAATDNRLLMTRNEYIAEIASLIPFFITKNQTVSNPDYKKATHHEFIKLNVAPTIHITDDYSSDDLSENTIAYHRIRGMITAESSWRVSTKQLQQDIIQADNNPMISVHFLHITSGGGEAWFMDQLAATIRGAQKPTIAFIEKVAASAAYYIASQTNHISASTPYDMIGCIGTMVGFMDIQPMFEKFGIKFIEEYATNSDLKNKKYNDLRSGKPDQFITEELNPLCDQFIQDVKSCRSIIAALPEDHPVLRGETFYADKSIENGLIDSIESFDNAILRAHDAGIKWTNNHNQRRQAIQYLNS